MKKSFSLGVVIIILLSSCSKEDDTIKTTIPAAPPFLQKVSHDIAEDVEQLRGIPRTEGHTLRIDTSSFFDKVHESNYIGDMYEPMKQCGFFTTRTRSTIPHHWKDRYGFWEGSVGGYFTESSPADIHVVLPHLDSLYLHDMLVSSPVNLKTIAHEYTHLLQHQMGYLDDLSKVNSIRSLSRALLMPEGDATFMMDLWGNLYSTGTINLDSIIQFEAGEVDIYEEYLIHDNLSDFEAFFYGHYIYGAIYTANAYKSGGIPAINALFDNDSLSVAEIISGKKQQKEDVTIGTMKALFPEGVPILSESLGANFISILFNRRLIDTEDKKKENFRKQYGVLDDAYYAVRNGSYYQSVWKITFTEQSNIALASKIFKAINSSGNGAARPALTLKDTFTENEYSVQKFETTNFISYIVVKGTTIWIIDNPQIHDRDLIALLK